MALVVLLRGINVGGHRAFRPTALAERLRHLDVVSIGSAGTFVIRRRVGRERVRAEFARRLPFATEIVVCDGRELLGLLSRDPFAGQRLRPDVVRFVSVLSRAATSVPRLPVQLPARGRWLLKVLAHERRFVVGLYRRHLRVVGYLGSLDRLFGAKATTRSWSTLAAIARVLRGGATA